MPLTDVVPPGSLLVDGAYRAGSDSGTRPVLEKATGRTIGTVAEATVADVDQAVHGARAAQRYWASTPGPVRAEALRRVAALLDQNRAELVDLLIRESGSVRAKAEGEVAGCIDELYGVGALTLEPVGEILPSATPGRINVVERRPVGVVGLITAWNFPMDIAFRVLGAALALGNAVVLKPAPSTPLSGGLAWAKLFADAGVPAGVVQVMPGDAAGPALVVHPGVDLIHFTGSTAVGHVVAAAAATSLKKVALELGGNNPTIVLADADLDLAVEKAAAASFLHQGQVCVATSRHIVVREIAADYLAGLMSRAGALRVGDPAVDDVDIGPLVDERQAARAEGMVEAAVSAGAKVAAGGRRSGLFFDPTVVSEVRPGMELFDDELFAPIAPVTVVADEAEALAVANSTRHGLSASIFTADLERGWALARQVSAGMVHVNDMSAMREAHVPFGGMGSSGAGTPFGGRANVELLTERHWVSLQSDRIAGLGGGLGG
jgi:benzaldehyde dehydrogenase (NAD)